MSTDRKKPGQENKGIGARAITAVTAAALVIAMVMITLSRVSNPEAAVISTPPITTSPAIAASTPATKPSPSLTPPPITSAPALNLMTSKGTPTAPVTIIEYSDFQCGHCQQFALTVERELETTYIDTGKVRLIYRFMTVYDEDSQRANEAAACAAEQGKFWPYFYLLMQLHASPKADDLSYDNLIALARPVGLNVEQFSNSLLSRKYEAKVRQDDAEGRAMGVTGTPTFFINGIKKDGAGSLKDLAAIIDPFLAKAGN